MTTLTLAQARKLISGCFSTLPAEDVPLSVAAGRIAACPLRAPAPVPGFARSTMDGCAVQSRNLTDSGTAVHLDISGEIAAGATELPVLAGKTAIRIMTGGAIPRGANQVVPSECCQQLGQQVIIRSRPQPGACIRARGADLRTGQTIIQAGGIIEPQHLPLLAESGLARVSVVRFPELAILCTGSELLPPLATPEKGQIIGGNRFLLEALLRKNGAGCLDLGLVSDDLEKIMVRLQDGLNGPGQAILTTGGMGPGTYDLLPRAFAALGITPLYSSLAVRPGRSTMFGLSGHKAIFALPGPPSAVFLLFHELILPALEKIQGLRHPRGPLLRAPLSEPVLLKKTGILNLRGGVIRMRDGALSVRPARALEPASAIIHVPAGRRHLRTGEKVQIRLVAAHSLATPGTREAGKQAGPLDFSGAP